jgi:hypothetical protein
LVLDDSALDTGCQGKHVFFFECDQCGGFSATAMNNIPVEEWQQFIPASQLERMVANYHAASNKG